MSELKVAVCPQCHKPLSYASTGGNTVPVWYCELHGAIYDPVWMTPMAVSWKTTTTQQKEAEVFWGPT